MTKVRAKAPKEVTFHNYNIEKCTTNRPGECLDDITSNLDHRKRHIDLFKIDCEKCEYDVLPDLMSMVRAGNITVGQINIEMHGTNPTYIRSLFQNIRSAGFYIFHKERNHWGCYGYKCLEYSLISNETAKDAMTYRYCQVERARH